MNQVSNQNLLDHLAMHIGKAALDAVVIKAQALVVQAQQVQNGRVENVTTIYDLQDRKSVV